jgi:putative transposase
MNSINPKEEHGRRSIRLPGYDYSTRRAPTINNIERFGKPAAGSIPTIVLAFKSAITYCVGKELNSSNLWQSNYYEHIIRDAHDYERIVFYIAQNPSNWSEDKENPYISAF